MLYMFKAVKMRANGTQVISQPAPASYFEATRFPANFLGNRAEPRIELRLLNDVVDPTTGINDIRERIINIPADADTVYVMNEAGDTIDTYRVNDPATEGAAKSRPLQPKSSQRMYPPPPHTHSYTLHPTDKDKR